MTPPTNAAEPGPRANRRSVVRWLLLGAGLLSLATCLVLLPCANTVRDGEGWVYSANNLKQIGQALRDYHEMNGCLPPAVVTGKDGRPLYSWRMLLLPYLEQNNLYRQFHLDEPWDSEHNKKLLEPMPRCYVPWSGSQDAPGLTRYQVFVGPGTAFERSGLTWDDFPDGLADTVLVVEATDPVPWTKPADLVYAPDRPLPRLGGTFHRSTHVLCYEVGGRSGLVAVFADGSTRFIVSTDERALRGIITRNGGEKINVSGLE